MPFAIKPLFLTGFLASMAAVKQMYSTTLVAPAVLDDSSNRRLGIDPESAGPPYVASETKSPRILLGILTTDRPKDIARRRMIRNTYLSMYETLTTVNNKIDITNPICSLSSLLKSYEEGQQMDHCSIVYTFVVGAHDRSNMTAVPDLTESESVPAGTPFVLDRPGPEGESDITYLNIRENMNKRKSVTWFSYASREIPEALGIDLIFKVDTDAVVFPRGLLRNIDPSIPERPARRIYGGLSNDRQKGDPNDPEARFMQGGFYFMSRDVARGISSPECPRPELVEKFVSWHGFRAEDREIAYFVRDCWSLNDSVSPQDRGEKNELIKMLLKSTSAKHGKSYKEDDGFRHKFRKGLGRHLARVRLDALRQTTWKDSPKGCPPTREEYAASLKWFDDQPRLKQKMLEAKKAFNKILVEECNPKASAEQTQSTS